MPDLNNATIAKHFQLLAKLMELHGDNKFKIRSYQNAYQRLRKIDIPLSESSLETLQSIEGVGKAIAEKIKQLSETGRLDLLESYKDKTPKGIQELLGIRGLGPKKIKLLWDELGIESPGELLYACEENRLVNIKGMGPKTQENIIQQLEFYLQAKDQFRLDQGVQSWQAFQFAFPVEKLGIRPTGEIRRKMPILQAVEILMDEKMKEEFTHLLKAHQDVDGVQVSGQNIEFKFQSVDFKTITAPTAQLETQLLKSTGGMAFPDIEEVENISSEKTYFSSKSLPYIPPELRDHPHLDQWLQTYNPDHLVRREDIRGMIHLHTDWSDGGASLDQMVLSARDRGYEYIAITDHSEAAFYANGLNAERLRKQKDAISQLNQPGIEVIPGCEVDIMPDGSMDLDEEILSELPLVIASVHSQLRMDREKATQRLISAIEHPQVNMLGHPTGRLILSRPGYAIDHRKVIDACSANDVCIEINANPLRLDIDWHWVPYCMEKGVMISINPDAHSISQMDLVRYGVFMARKGGLIRDYCLNAQTYRDFMKQLKK